MTPPSSLAHFFRPEAIAVIGASRDEANLGHRLLRQLLAANFAGPIYPINPKAERIAGLPAYHSIAAIPGPCPLAFVCVPRDAVLAVVEECAAKGIKALVVISAGFAEVDARGKQLQEELTRLARTRGVRVIGPNCLGLVNTDPRVRLAGTFAAAATPPPGRVAMLSQSGAVGLALLAAAGSLGLGVSTFVSSGNQADVSLNDLLEWWEQDDQTDAILLYLESFGNPRNFARLARRVSRRKPIIALKSGRTKAGQRAAGSHTAALFSNDLAVAALFRQTGIVRAETLEEFFGLALAVDLQPLPRGRRLAVITNAGGPGILCADAAEEERLQLPELSAELRAELAAFLPPAASTANPVDLIASATPEQFQRAVTSVLTRDEVDALVVIYIPVGLGVAEPERVQAAVQAGVRAAGRSDLPVYLCLMLEAAARPPQIAEPRLPVFSFPEEPARALAKLAGLTEWRMRHSADPVVFADLPGEKLRAFCRERLGADEQVWLEPGEIGAFFQLAGLPALEGSVAQDADEAARLAETLGLPVAVKLAMRAVVHKTEIGGVRLNLRSGDEVRTAVEEMARTVSARIPDAGPFAVLVQPMVGGGVELMVGLTRDPLFGPLLAFGLGGIHVEVLGDVVFRVAPLSEPDAQAMLASLRGAKLLEGYRGHPPADRAALLALLLRLSAVAEAVPELAELDLNPLFALAPGAGLRLVDARILLRRA